MRKDDTSQTGELYCDTRLGGAERWYYGKPEDADMRIPRDIVNCVAFICVKAKDRYGLLYDHFIGTAYFVRRTQFGSEAQCLVTAKHVLTDAMNEGYTEFYVRLNTFDGSSETIPIPSRWVEHENPAVDVAVLPFLVPDRKFSHYSLPLSAPYFAIHEHMIGMLEIGIGDDLFVTGLFSHRWGHTRNIPVVRSGIIAAMPDEPLVDDETENGNLFQAYLAEMRSIGGLSGSPVFVVRWRRPPDFLPEHELQDPLKVADYLMKYVSRPPSTHFLGMVRGHYDLKKQAQDSALRDLDAREIERLNAGIAVITPAWDVLAVLDGEDFMNKMRESAKERRIESAPTKDSTLPPKRPESEGAITPEGFEEALRRASRKVSQPESESDET